MRQSDLRPRPLVREHVRPRSIETRTALIRRRTDGALELAVQRRFDLRLRDAWCRLGGAIALVAEVQM